MPIYAPGLGDDIRKPERIGSGVRPDKILEVKYRGRLLRINRTLQDEYMRLAGMIRDGMINQGDALHRLGQIEEAMAMRGISRGIASGIVHQANATNLERLQNSFKRAFSVDVFGIVDEQGLRHELDGMIEENVSLISSIPRDSVDMARRAVIANYRGEELPGGTLIQELQRIGRITKNRAKLIARDQTSKLNASINQVRQQSIGIEEYIWRNSQDERVVGRLGGLYPNGNKKHGNHWIRQGKRFRWDTPPPDGHPGQPIACRCHADPVIDIDKLKR